MLSYNFYNCILNSNKKPYYIYCNNDSKENVDNLVNTAYSILVNSFSQDIINYASNDKLTKYLSFYLLYRIYGCDMPTLLDDINEHFMPMKYYPSREQFRTLSSTLWTFIQSLFNDESIYDCNAIHKPYATVVRSIINRYKDYILKNAKNYYNNEYLKQYELAYIIFDVMFNELNDANDKKLIPDNNLKNNNHQENENTLTDVRITESEYSIEYSYICYSFMCFKIKILNCKKNDIVGNVFVRTCMNDVFLISINLVIFNQKLFFQPSSDERVCVEGTNKLFNLEINYSFNQKDYYDIHSHTGNGYYIYIYTRKYNYLQEIQPSY